MKYVIACSLGALSLLAAGPVRAAVVLNFDNLTGAANSANGATVPAASDLPVNYFVAAYGLLINSYTNSLADPHVGVGVANLGFATPSSPNAIVGTNTLGRFNYASFLSFTFVNPSDSSQAATTDFFSLQDPINSGAQIAMYAYGVNNNFLGSVTHTANGSATWSLSFPGIHYIRFGDPNSNPLYAADNVTFDSVPEPASLLLLSAGTIPLLRKRLKTFAPTA